MRIHKSQLASMQVSFVKKNMVYIAWNYTSFYFKKEERKIHITRAAFLLQDAKENDEQV